MVTALHNLQLITNGTIVSGKAILIEGNVIKAVTDAGQLPAGIKSIDLNGAYAAPGLIDLQIYGAGTKLFGGNPSVEALAEMEDVLLKQGTTGFLATIATNSDEVVLQGIDAAKQYMPHAKGNFLGLHLEGPYLNPKRKGAHPESFIKKAVLTELKSWVERGEGIIKMITIAPELQDAEVVEYLALQNIIISAGHTDATYDQALQFLNNPVKAATHLFNAMPQMHHREPGIIPAIFEKRPYTSIVADGIHVSFPMIALAKRELGEKLFFITDAVTVANEGAYQHQLKDGRFVMPDGTLSGSALTMLKAVENGVKKIGISLPEAINMASLYPAQLASLTKKGKIEAGYFADLIIFNDSFAIATTVLQGEIVYNTNQ
ncbi:N-acetylglucosamine-6-phosphate deacetylase [Mucilaginibacter sp. UR6-1]|uniref:N-acetylglucosamine-6-phosphate deacetylase n=1 Tax=Mucilaginibacter sp. UR6-1 TaxID=1435643 RepID=UPI001E356EFD|nr:N-acetylglucosamine-6-phosphate deacetylase [Mucilaginibacter sp. UR6-1]MCC8408333.1 N-acetylglucosamine-6-phosphate deacetylase [Mucilaginibacter sp. UR6-1]